MILIEDQNFHHIGKKNHFNFISQVSMSNIAKMTHPLILLYSDWPKNKIVID